MTSPSFSGYVIFCDDIRREYGGKVTLVGVYRSAMYIHNTEPPFAIPKFAIAVRYRESSALPREETNFQIFLPGGKEDVPLLKGRLVITQQAHQTDSEYIEVGADIILAPLVIQKEGSIKVKVQRGAEEMEIGTLQVKKGTPLKRN